jgi:hypothetical protein
MKIDIGKWMLGYLLAEAVLVTLSATIGHGQSGAWYYGVIASSFAWLIVSVFAVYKRWLTR